MNFAREASYLWGDDERCGVEATVGFGWAQLWAAQSGSLPPLTLRVTNSPRDRSPVEPAVAPVVKSAI
jgi:hypothetical protein